MPVVLPDSPKTLRCASFHSVKGGVGKSTLSYLVARLLAEEGPVVLVDADLTGTSLADVLPLRAPRWNGVGADQILPLNLPPDEWSPCDLECQHLANRASFPDGHLRVVPLLNDFLLWAKGRYDATTDVDPRALFWRLLEDDPLVDSLFVIPSSALPNDLTQIMPLIYDELHAAYLESRLEWLLHWILEKTDVRTVVFDTPPTIPGLSRAVLSMAMRLPEYVDLAVDGGTPRELTKEYTERINWTPFLVVTPDIQDLRAAERWLEGPDNPDIDRIQVVLNRATKSWNDLKQELPHKLSGGGDLARTLYEGKLLRSPLVVSSASSLKIFRRDPHASDVASNVTPLVARMKR
ncbi:MAG: ParA family protein [Byssovorax sp.]